MAASVFTRINSISTLRFKTDHKSGAARGTPKSSVNVQASFSDPFVLQLAESLEDSLSACSSSSAPCSSIYPLQRIRDISSESVLSTPWPSRRDEAFRFTDTSFIRNAQIQPVTYPSSSSNFSRQYSDAQSLDVVIVDGFPMKSEIHGSELPDGVYVGSFSGLSEEIARRVSEFVGQFQYGDVFWCINGLGAPDLTVVYVPVGCSVDALIRLRHFSVENGDEGSKRLPVTNPRAFVLVERGGKIAIAEEFVGGEENGFYWTNSVLEIVVGEGASIQHSYVQSESPKSAHVKWTSVRQEKESSYELVEVSTGGKLGRHNVHVQQLGPDTQTELTTFHLSTRNQTLDLHSRIIMDHPRGRSQQLHKCIVAHPSGQAVFDGNVRVNKYAQQTDAGQLTRSLLLEPRATVNVKPNLQIIADDVKCSHGAAISDLEESQLFYFRARGVDIETARRALILSFGEEVIELLPYSFMRKQALDHVKTLLQLPRKSLP